MYPMLSYAQIHYYPNKFFKGFLYKKEPVILIDVPEMIFGHKLPIYLIIKNSDIFPVFIEYVEVVHEQNIERFKLNKKINKFFSYEKFIMDFESMDEIVELEFKIFYSINGKRKSCGLSNYPFVKKKTLNCYLCGDNDFYENFISADMHVHSIFTDDHVEFGSSVDIYNDVSKYINLDFFAITDHSYDLDDQMGKYYLPDESLRKWNKLIEYNLKYKKMILGEEVSCGNVLNKNVHALVYGDDFIYGYGDSGEKLFENSPNISLDEIVKNNKFVAAAHPFDKPGIAEGILLNRGYYTKQDLSDVFFMQILNKDFNMEHIEIWIDMLISGNVKYLLAGNDSHGYLGWAPHIKFPLFKIGISEDFLFARNRTYMYSEKKLTKEEYLEMLYAGKSAITTGPLIYLFQENNKIKIFAKSMKFWGELLSIDLIFIKNGEKKNKSIVVKEYLHSSYVEILLDTEIVVAVLRTSNNRFAVSNLLKF